MLVLLFDTVILVDYSDYSNITRVWFPDIGPVSLYYSASGYRLLDNSYYPIINYYGSWIHSINWSTCDNPIVLNYSFQPRSNSYEQIGLVKINESLLLMYNLVQGIVDISNPTNFTYSSDIYQYPEYKDILKSHVEPFFCDNYIYCLNLYELESKKSPLAIWKISK